MTSEQFTYWLQGFAELHPEAPSAEQWQAIRDHLALVFEKQTPERFAPVAPIPPIHWQPGGIPVSPTVAAPHLPATTIC